MKTNFKITSIKKVIINGAKATRFDIYELIDNTWVYQFSSKIFAHRSTVSGIESQILRENSKWGHEAAYII